MALLESIRKEREQTEAELKQQQEQELKRQQKLKVLKDIPTALKHIEDNYDFHRLQEVCVLVSKVLETILKNPVDAKFRTLKLKNPKVEVWRHSALCT